MLPGHTTYVEPFAGSAAVLFVKEPCDVEVINDADPEIADAYRLIKKLSPARRTFKPRIRARRLQAIAATVPAFARFPAIAVRR